MENTDNGVLKIPEFVQLLPYKEKIISLWEHNISNSSSITDIINKFSKETLFSFSSSLLSGLVNKIVTILVMFISFYFMLKNGSNIKENYREILNYWIGKKAIHQIDNGIESLRGTINGVVLIGILEGVLLSIPLVASEFPSGFAIGLAAGILGVIPLLMPILIAPCLAYLYFSGDTTWAIIGMVDLTLVWFVCENIIKPQVIGKKVKVNTFIILASMIGGMQLLGFLGLFVGPALVSMAIGMLSDILTIDKDEEK
jgi:predicted PurR-regulated permease PerM